MIRIRDSTRDDAEVVTEIVNWGLTEPNGVEQVRERLNAPATSPNEWRMVAEDDAGQVIGYGHALRDDWMEPGLFWLNIAVAVPMQRQGIGTTIYAALLDWLRPRAATKLLASAYDHLPQSVQFAERMGFYIERHIFESTLDLTTFDERPFLGAVERAQTAGLRFASLADLDDSPAARRLLWEVESAITHDIPGHEQTGLRPFEAFNDEVCGAPTYRADCQFLALDGERGVGLARLDATEATEAMYNSVTGVLPAYRGRGLALALKLLAARAARAHGARYLRTNNDAENAPMLAVNRRLGYQPEPGYYRMRADLPGAKQTDAESG